MNGVEIMAMRMVDGAVTRGVPARGLGRRTPKPQMFNQDARDDSRQGTPVLLDRLLQQFECFWKNALQRVRHPCLARHVKSSVERVEHRLHGRWPDRV